jgi:hypothetical protein
MNTRLLAGLVHALLIEAVVAALFYGVWRLVHGR